MLACCLCEPAEVPHEALQGHAGGEVASPEGMRVIRIGKEIVVFGGIGGSLRPHGLDVVTGSGVLDGDSELRPAVDVVQQFIDILEPHPGVGVLEVFAQGVEQVGGAVVIGHGLEVVHEVLGAHIDVVVLESRVVLDGLVPADIVEAESRRWTVVVVVDMREHVVGLVSAVLQRTPHHLHGLVVQPPLLVLVVDPREEESLEAHLAEESSRGRVVAKGIDVPGYLRHHVEGILDPSQTNSHLVHKVLVVHIGLVRHAPARIDELDLLVGHQRLHLFALFGGRVVPPTVEEGDLNDGKLVFWMFGQLSDNCVDGIGDPSKLSPHISSVEVVINGLEPPHVIVRVGNQVDGQRRTGIGLVVMFFEHLLVVEAKGRVREDEDQQE